MPKARKVGVLVGKIVGAVIVFFVALLPPYLLFFYVLVELLRPGGLKVPWQLCLLFLISVLYLLPLPTARARHLGRPLGWITVPLFAAGILSALVFLSFLLMILKEHS